jgi:hypothetical protein
MIPNPSSEANLHELLNGFQDLRLLANGDTAIFVSQGGGLGIGEPSGDPWNQTVGEEKKEMISFPFVFPGLANQGRDNATQGNRKLP